MDKTKMELELSRGGRDMSVTHKREISNYIDAVIAEYHGNNEMMNQIALECAVKLSNAKSISSELANQSFLKNAWRTVTGKNRKLGNQVTRSMADSQYAAQLMLVKLREQNALTMDVVVELDKKNNKMFLEVDNKLLKTNKNIERVYDALLAYAATTNDSIKDVRSRALTACPQCGTPMSFEAVLCPHCGCVNPAALDDVNEDTKKDLDSLISVLQDAIKKNSQKKPPMFWDKTVSDYASRIIRCREILNTDIMRNLITGPAQDLYAQMDEFIEKCHDAMFKVAIVGTVKAGKSTLINALLGDELASTEVTPETSVLAKFCNSNDTDYIKVTFYTSKEWAELTKSGEGREQGFVEQFNRHGDPGLNGKYINKKSMLIKADSRGELKKHIEKWTASTTPEHFYVSEVVIGIKNSVLPDGILLVDTPGLNDPVKYRSEVTRNYIHSAHAVIVCLTADNIENADLCFIGRVQTNLETSSLGNVFIVATQIDRLNKPLEKWPKQKEHFIDTLKVLYKNTPNLLPQRLFGVTAYMQNFINKYRAPGFEGFSDDDEFELESLLNRYKIRLSVFNEKIELLESYTGIHSLLDAMKLYLFNNSRKQLLHAVEVRYDKLSAGINSVLGRIETEQKKIMDAGKSDRKGIGQKISDQLQIIDELKNDRTEFENAMGQLKRGLSEIYNQVKANIERG